MNLLQALYPLKVLMSKDSFLYKKIRTMYRKYMMNNNYLALLNHDFRAGTGYNLNLESPQTFNEKLQWLKCYYRDPLMARCADKVTARTFVKERIGGEHLIPIYGIYNKVEEIDLEELPDRFVLKTNHASGQVIICKDKHRMDWKNEFKKLKGWLESNYYYESGEWIYKDIQPKIICERLLDENISDYKFYCFSGKPEILLICFDRPYNLTMNYYDMNFNFLKVKQSSDNNSKQVNMPKKFELMKSLAAELSAPFPHVRVDFFAIDDQVYFSELTFFDSNGMEAFEPVEWDYRLGSMIELPKQNVFDNCAESRRI